MEDFSGYIGYLRLTDSDMKDGIFGARQSAEILQGFDSALRFVLEQEDSSLSSMKFEIPVKIQEGSLLALIPDTVDKWIAAGIGLPTVAYLTAAGTQMGANDFKDKSITDIAKVSLRKLQGVIQIAKHRERMGDKQAGEGIRFTNDNNEVEIPNEQGDYLLARREDLELYLKTPKLTLDGITRVLTPNRTIAIAEIERSGNAKEEVISFPERHIFTNAAEDDAQDILFPEMLHGQRVELSGAVTRGNRKTNTIGFEYQGHILTCTPIDGNITEFKDSLFKNCLIRGYVTRHDDPTDPDSRRPHINFDELVPLLDDNDQQTSFL